MPNIANITNGEDDTDNTAYQSASFTPIYQELYVVFVYTRQAAGAAENINAAFYDGVSTIGPSTTIAQVNGSLGATSIACILCSTLQVGVAQTLTIWGGSFLAFNTTRTGCHWSVNRVSRAAAFGNGLLTPEFVQVKAPAWVNVSETAHTIALDAVPNRKNCVLAAGSIGINDATFAPDHTSITTTVGTAPAARFNVQRSIPGAQSMGWTWTTANNGFVGISVEIAASRYPRAILL